MSTTLRNRDHQAMMSVLQACRKEAELTQVELSGLLNRAPNYIAKIENGERKCTVPELFEIAKGIGIDPQTLFARMSNW